MVAILVRLRADVQVEVEAFHIGGVLGRAIDTLVLSTSLAGLFNRLTHRMRGEINVELAFELVGDGGSVGEILGEVGVHGRAAGGVLYRMPTGHDDDMPQGRQDRGQELDGDHCPTSSVKRTRSVGASEMIPWTV